MIRYLLAATLLWASGAASAQQPASHPAAMMHHGESGMMDMPTSAEPKETGQAAFAAIQEIVSILNADPDTDWSKVNIEALRRHLVDMNNVTLYAQSTATPIAHGMQFTITGQGAVRGSVQRMVLAHAKTMNGWHGWSFAAKTTPDGATLTVTVPTAADLEKLRGLGFIGVMASGMHHQHHHLMIATGMAPHK
ncbi:hypothetical protein [Kordiimonas marina]|uniref:hypothetical protein n=1 Tax=Kordiimonas marina TaxID=2872312 RepID=UPI001FF473F1|nr:hypothetical protein [Kordiimonas marina]MCJ9428165.1 hypothetical protein [Kordiimonas marina]